MKAEVIGLIDNPDAVAPWPGAIFIFTKGDGRIYTVDAEGGEKLIGLGLPRVQQHVSETTVTPDADTNDCVELTYQGTPVTIANATGTPFNFQKLIIRIRDNGIAQAITFDTDYVAGGVGLPTTTVPLKTTSMGFIYNTSNSLNKWQLVALAEEA